MSFITGFAVAGQGIQDILNYWADQGVFAYVLPFLLIFAVVYGILSKANFFGQAGSNKGVNAVIAITIGLLSLVGGYVPDFFQTILPFAAIGISVLLVALILMGLFFDISDSNEKWPRFVFFGLGAIIALVVIANSLSSLNWAGGFAWSEYGPAIITLIIILVLIVLVIGGKKGENSPLRSP